MSVRPTDNAVEALLELPAGFDTVVDEVGEPVGTINDVDVRRAILATDDPSTLTVADEREANIHVHEGVTEEQFVAMRKARDAQLEMPVLILPSVQVNMRAGHLPEPEDNGMRYLKIPLNAV